MNDLIYIAGALAGCHVCKLVLIDDKKGEGLFYALMWIGIGLGIWYVSSEIHNAFTSFENAISNLTSL